MILKKIQKNRLFEIIEDSGLPISLFKFVENESKPKSKKLQTSIKVINHPYHFTFEDDDGSIAYVYSPGNDWLTVDGDVSDFDDLVSEFYSWIDFLHEELETEDKWDKFNQIISSLNFADFESNENEKFSASEFLELTNKFTQLKNSLGELKLKDNQLEIITGKLDSVLNQAIHLGKFDWKSLFIGTVVSVILQLSLSQEQGKSLWQIIKNIFASLFLTQ